MPLTGSTYAASGYVPCGDGWRNSLHAVESGEQQHYASFGDGYYLQRHTDNGILVLHRSIVGAHLASPGLSGQRAVERGGSAYDNRCASCGCAFMDCTGFGVHIHREPCSGVSGACSDCSCLESGDDSGCAFETRFNRVEGSSKSLGL